jgi:acetylornithine aminotransferase
MVASQEVGASLTAGSHGSTYGANPLCVAAAIATLETMEQEGLLERAQEISAYILEKTQGLREQFGFIEDVRGRGLMIGIELSLPGGPIATAALERGLRVNVTQDTVLRLLPAMTISTAEVDEAFEILTAAFQATESKLVTT